MPAELAGLVGALMTISDTIYHYCPPEAFLKILTSKTLWMSHIEYFEDQQEHRWFKNIACEAIQKRDPTTSNPDLQRLRDALLTRSAGMVFAASFSQERDLLQQWNAYADRGIGFAIGFDSRWLQDFCMQSESTPTRYTLGEVVYDREVQATEADRFLEAMLRAPDMDSPDKNQMYTVLSRVVAEMNVNVHAAFCKNALFNVEREARLVRRGGEWGLDLKFRMRGSQVVPYVEFPFKLEAIREIIFGPRVPKATMETHIKAINLVLNCNEFSPPGAPQFLTSELELA